MQTDFLQDQKGNNSSMRLVFVGAFIVAVLIAAAVMVGAFKGLDKVVEAGMSLVTAFLLIVSGAKVGQSITETWSGKK